MKEKKLIGSIEAANGGKVDTYQLPDGRYEVTLSTPEKVGLDDYANSSGGRVAMRRQIADGEVGIIVNKTMDTSPEAVASLARMDAALTHMSALLRSESVPSEVLVAFNEVLASLNDAMRVKNEAHVKDIDKLIGLLEELRKVEAQAKARRRTQVNPAAKAKAEAKQSAERLWNKWMDERPRKSWTNEQFAIEAMRMWPGKFGSIAVVVGHIPGWKRARSERQADEA